MRLLPWLAAFLVACTSPQRIEMTAGPQQIAMPTAPPKAATFDLSDGRPSEAVAGGKFDTSEFFGDERFTPSRMVLVRDALEKCCSDTLARRRVVLTHFEVSIQHKQPEPYGKIPVFVPTSGPTLVGNLIGALIIMGIEGTRGERNACTLVRVEVGEDTYSGSACQPAGLSDQEEAVKQSISTSFTKLSEFIRAQPPRN